MFKLSICDQTAL